MLRKLDIWTILAGSLYKGVYWRQKVKLYLFLIKHRDIKTYECVAV
jgi:hypothetical protein